MQAETLYKCFPPMLKQILDILIQKTSTPRSFTGTKRNRMVARDHENFMCLLNSKTKSPSEEGQFPAGCKDHMLH